MWWLSPLTATICVAYGNMWASLLGLLIGHFAGMDAWTAFCMLIAFIWFLYKEIFAPKSKPKTIADRIYQYVTRGILVALATTLMYYATLGNRRYGTRVDININGTNASTEHLGREEPIRKKYAQAVPGYRSEMDQRRRARLIHAARTDELAETKGWARSIVGLGSLIVVLTSAFIGVSRANELSRLWHSLSEHVLNIPMLVRACCRALYKYNVISPEDFSDDVENVIRAADDIGSNLFPISNADLVNAGYAVPAEQCVTMPKKQTVTRPGIGKRSAELEEIRQKHMKGLASFVKADTATTSAEAGNLSSSTASSLSGGKTPDISDDEMEKQIPKRESKLTAEPTIMHKTIKLSKDHSDDYHVPENGVKVMVDDRSLLGGEPTDDVITQLLPIATTYRYKEVHQFDDFANLPATALRLENRHNCTSKNLHPINYETTRVFDNPPYLEGKLSLHKLSKQCIERKAFTSMWNWFMCPWCMYANNMTGSMETPSTTQTTHEEMLHAMTTIFQCPEGFEDLKLCVQRWKHPDYCHPIFYFFLSILKYNLKEIKKGYVMENLSQSNCLAIINHANKFVKNIQLPNLNTDLDFIDIIQEGMEKIEDNIEDELELYDSSRECSRYSDDSLSDIVEEEAPIKHAQSGKEQKQVYTPQGTLGKPIKLVQVTSAQAQLIVTNQQRSSYDLACDKIKAFGKQAYLTKAQETSLFDKVAILSGMPKMVLSYEFVIETMIQHLDKQAQGNTFARLTAPTVIPALPAYMFEDPDPDLFDRDMAQTIRERRQETIRQHRMALLRAERDNRTWWNRFWAPRYTLRQQTYWNNVKLRIRNLTNKVTGVMANDDGLNWFQRCFDAQRTIILVIVALMFLFSIWFLYRHMTEEEHDEEELLEKFDQWQAETNPEPGHYEYQRTKLTGAYHWVKISDVEAEAKGRNKSYRVKNTKRRQPKWTYDEYQRYVDDMRNGGAHVDFIYDYATYMTVYHPDRYDDNTEYVHKRDRYYTPKEFDYYGEGKEVGSKDSRDSRLYANNLVKHVDTTRRTDMTKLDSVYLGVAAEAHKLGFRSEDFVTLRECYLGKFSLDKCKELLPESCHPFLTIWMTWLQPEQNLPSKEGEKRHLKDFIASDIGRLISELYLKKAAYHECKIRLPSYAHAYITLWFPWTKQDPQVTSNRINVDAAVRTVMVKAEAIYDRRLTNEEYEAITKCYNGKHTYNECLSILPEHMHMFITIWYPWTKGTNVAEDRIQEALSYHQLPNVTFFPRVWRLMVNGKEVAHATQCNGGFLVTTHSIVNTELDADYENIINGWKANKKIVNLTFINEKGLCLEKAFGFENREYYLFNANKELMWINYIGLPKTAKTAITSIGNTRQSCNLLVNVKTGSDSRLTSVNGDIWQGLNDLETDISTVPGFCGAPYFITENKVPKMVGIHYAGSASSRINYAIPLSDIEEEFQACTGSLFC